MLPHTFFWFCSKNVAETILIILIQISSCNIYHCFSDKLFEFHFPKDCVFIFTASMVTTQDRNISKPLTGYQLQRLPMYSCTIKSYLNTAVWAVYCHTQTFLFWQALTNPWKCWLHLLYSVDKKKKKKKIEPTFVSEEETGFLVSLFTNPTTVRSPGTLQKPGGQRFKNKKHHAARQSKGETRPRLHVNERWRHLNKNKLLINAMQTESVWL